MSNVKESIEEILQEIQMWENAPINELLGVAQRNLNQSVKRIIVYGPTQVGKTTMIMDLIGIMTERQDELGEILRGGAEEGTSSTSSAIIYNRWDEKCFGLRIGNINGEVFGELTRYEAEAFRQKIQEINDANRGRRGIAGDVSAHDILYYYLPEDFFEEDAASKDLQIVDLPGFGERDEVMRKKADEIIRYLSGIVAGAIVVVKSENIQKLESDYKVFIDQHHQNHLAIVVSYALKTSSVLRDMIAEQRLGDGSTDDRALAVKLSEYYHKIIASENYMQFDQSNQSQIIFPVEHSVYLADNYPHLNGVFAESRKLLRERVERMKNRTSIEACIEELQQRNKMLDISIQEATERQSLLEIELGKLEKNRARTNKELQEYEESHKEIEKKYEHWKATFDEVKDAVNRIPKKKLMTEKQAADFWYSCSGTSDEEQAQLYQWLYRKIENWLGKKEPVHKKLTDQLMQCAVRALNQEDLPDMLQQRDRRGFLWLEKWYGPASREHASWRADKIASSVYEKMKNVIMAYERDEGGILCSLLKEAKANLQKAKAEQRRTENKCKETAEALERCSKNIMYYREQMEGNIANQRKVKRVFIEHYRKKEKNLYGRIEKATEPEIKAALFLTLSAINLTMKPYLEECNHGESEGIR